MIPISNCPLPLYRQVLELWEYGWNPVIQSYQRISFRALLVTQPAENPVDLNLNVEDFYAGNTIFVQRRLDSALPPPPPGVVPSRPPPPPPPMQTIVVPPARPPPPNFTQQRQVSPVSPAASPESPESPDPSEPYSPTDTPTKRNPPSPPAWSPDRVHCDRSLYVSRQDHVFALPLDCPDHPKTPPKPFSAANPPLQPALEPRRRRAPPPPTGQGRVLGRGRVILSSRSAQTDSSPYARPPIPSEQSAFVRPPFQRARNLFADFIPNMPPSPPPMVRPFPEPAASPGPQPLPPSRSPSPDIFQEIYSHGRHPIDNRSHLTIIPSWAIKAEKEVVGECIICYGTDKHLQIRCQNCASQKVCCICVVGIYQSINPCPTCRFRGEF